MGVGSESFTYEVCDNSTPTPLCDSAIVTVVVQPIAGGGIQYRLVEIDYDVLGSAIVATVQTRTSDNAKVANVALDLTASSGLSTVLSGPTSGACDAASPAGSCDQFHVIRFSIDPCNVENAEMLLTAQFKCADGSDPNTCGYQNIQGSFTLDKLFLTYDACPRTVEFGIEYASSFLRLHDDVPRAVPISAPAAQESTVYGRCSIAPSAGAAFQSVTLSGLKVFQQNGNIDLGDQLGASFLTMTSPLTSTSASNAVFDFDLTMDASFFLLANTYYLEASLDLTFANTGPLTKKLVIPLVIPGNKKMLRSSVQLVALSARADDDGAGNQDGVFSEVFGVSAAPRVAAAQPSDSSSNDSAIIAAAVGIT